MTVGRYLQGLSITAFGMVALRMSRLHAERRARIGKSWKSETLTPPLRLSPRTKELIGRHYLKGRYAHLHQKVAWVTSGAPVEFLNALDYFTLYPENHAAVCGTLRLAEEMCTQAENTGYSREICSYARTDIGSLLSGRTPVGRLPKPDLLLACTNICQTVLLWYRVLAHQFKVPLILIDTPFIYTKVNTRDIQFVKRQIEQAIEIAEKVAGKTLRMANLERTVHLSRTASQLWMEIIERCQHRPAPISVFDQFIHMAPIVEMRGEPYTVDFYADMLKEIDQRIALGIGSITNEQKRLLWDNLPIWHRMRYLAEFLGKHGVAVVASTYTQAWGELAGLIDTQDLIEGLAYTYIYPILNRGTGDKLATMERMIEKYQLDGAILHSDRSCKPYSVGQMDQRNSLVCECNVPTLILEADHNDPRHFIEEHIANRLDAFIEMLFG